MKQATSPQFGSRTEWRIAFGIAMLGLVGIACWGSMRPSVEEQVAKEDAARAARAADIRAQLEASGHGGAKVMPEQAFQTCRTYLKRFSRDPERMQIPDVGWMRGGANWRFAWSDQSRLLRMRNGLGADVGTPGLCVIDEVTGYPLLLVVDGQELIGPHSTEVKP